MYMCIRVYMYICMYTYMQPSTSTQRIPTPPSIITTGLMSAKSAQFDKKKDMITRPVHRYFTTLYHLDMYMNIQIFTCINIYKYTYKASFCRTIQ